jgi:hypothetical protein
VLRKKRWAAQRQSENPNPARGTDVPQAFDNPKHNKTANKMAVIFIPPPLCVNRSVNSSQSQPIQFQLALNGKMPFYCSK